MIYDKVNGRWVPGGGVQATLFGRPLSGAQVKEIEWLLRGLAINYSMLSRDEITLANIGEEIEEIEVNPISIPVEVPANPAPLEPAVPGVPVPDREPVPA